MDFNLSPEQEALRSTVRDFAEKEIAPKAHQLNQNEEFSYELTRKMADLGLFGMTVSEEWGGGGYDYVSYIIAVEELARVDGSQAATVAADNSLGIGPVYYFGNKAQKDKYLPDLCAGKKLWGFGLTEPGAGSDAGGSKTRAEQAKDGSWVINGQKIFITNAANEMTSGVTVQTVSGRLPDGRKEYTCFIVEPGAPGFKQVSMHKKMVWKASNTAELYFDDVKVPDENILGKRGDGFKQMLQTLDNGRLSIAAMGLGCAQGAYETALKYVKERRQFGKALSEFQATQFKLADMAMKIDAARWQLYRACWMRDHHLGFEPYAAMAKLYCSEVAHECANHCVQLHGGYGLMEEYAAARFYRDQKLLEIGEGTSEVQRIVISRHLLKE